MEALEKCVRGIKADGLLWGAGKKMFESSQQRYSLLLKNLISD